MATLIEYVDGAFGAQFAIVRGVTRIGRALDNDISLEDELVSKEHAVIEMIEPVSAGESPQYYLRDLSSTNGTYVNGEAVVHCRLNNEDVIRMGVTFFQFIDHDQPDLGQTTKLESTWFPGVYYAKSKKPR